MANIQAGMSFYGEMPDMYSLVLNSDHKLIKDILSDENKACNSELEPAQAEMDTINLQRQELQKKHESQKDEEIPASEKDELETLNKKRIEQIQYVNQKMAERALRVLAVAYLDTTKLPTVLSSEHVEQNLVFVRINWHD